MAAATRGLAAAFLGLACLWAAPAPAQTQDQPTSTQPVSQQHPFVAELRTGLNDPLGMFGLALVYDRGGRFSGGLGLGLDRFNAEWGTAAGLFGRVRWLRVGNLAFDAGGILSRGRYQASRTYSAPFRAWPDRLTWKWDPDYRLTGTVGAAWLGRRWSLRVESGLTYHLGKPTCDYEGSGTEFHGSCNSSYIPEEYHFSSVPGRISLSVSLTLGYRMGIEDAIAVAKSPSPAKYRSPRTAQQLSGWSTGAPFLFGASMLGLGFATRSVPLAVGAVGIMGLGLSFGPSIGYAYAGEHLRAWGMGTLRAIAITAGSLAWFIAVMEESCDECNRGDGDRPRLLAYTLIGASFISALYDNVVVSKAAERANAHNGFSNISLLPMPIAGSRSVGPGLALGGQF